MPHHDAKKTATTQARRHEAMPARLCSLWLHAFVVRFPALSRSGGAMLLVGVLLAGCGFAPDTPPPVPPRGPVNPVGGTPPAQLTAIARLTATPLPAAPMPAAPMTPGAATPGGVNSATIAAGNAPQTASGSTPPSAGNASLPAGTAIAAMAAMARAASPVPVKEVPALPAASVMGGTSYTNPAMTFRFTVPPLWSSPVPDGPPTRVVARSPGAAVTLVVEDSTPPDDWRRLPPATVAGVLDAEYRAANPGQTLQTAVLTGVNGEGGLGLSTYRLTYSANNMATERFVVLTFAGAVSVTASGATDAYMMAKGTVEAIVGSLSPLKRDAPTPAALAPVTGGTASATGATRTPSGLALTLPTGWKMIVTPPQPPGVEFLATSADGQQSVRVIRKSVGSGVTLNDFAATAATEFKASTQGYDVEGEGENTVGGQRAVRVLYSGVVGGRPVEGQSVTLVRGDVGYVVMVEVPATQYADNEAEAQALFDRIGGSVMLP